MELVAVALKVLEFWLTLTSACVWVKLKVMLSVLLKLVAP